VIGLRKKIKNIDEIINDYIKNEFHQKDNANMSFCISGLYNWVNQYIFKKEAIQSLPKKVRKAHENGSIHIHDLWTSRYMFYCSSFNLEDIINNGLLLAKRAGAPKHFSTALNQIINFITSAQQEVAGAVAFNDFDILLAPLVKNDKLTYKQVKQEVQSLFFNINQASRYGAQAPFLNLTIAIDIPKRYENLVPMIDGNLTSFNYFDCEREIAMIDKAICEMHIEGDYNHTPFTFPIITVKIGKKFDYESETAKNIIEMARESGHPYFLNYNVDYIDEDSCLALCCRLKIEYDELQAHSGGVWSINTSTGSIGVVSINMPRIGLQAKDYNDIIRILDDRMELARLQLKIKRRNIKKSLDMGLLPTLKVYIPRGTDFHFSTIGVVGFHDFCMNYLGEPLWTKTSISLVRKILKHMNKKIVEFQKEDKVLYNLEATPAERTAARFAYYDKKRFKNPYISVNLNGKEEYTNSTQLPVDYPYLTKKIKVEGEFQRFFTGGSMTHIFIDEKPSHEGLLKFVKRITDKSNLGYFSITPTITSCKDCKGRFVGSFMKCPKCNGKTDIYSRIVGYYRPIRSWNPSKKEEFKRRKHFKI